MLDRIVLTYKLRRLETDRRRTSARYAKELRELRAKNANQDDIELLHHEEFSDIIYNEEEQYQLQHNCLTERARRYLLPVPDFVSKEKGGKWEEAPQSERWRLTQEALLELRSLIRKEEKERREHWQIMVAWVTAVSGLLGTMIGLVSVSGAHR